MNQFMLHVIMKANKHSSLNIIGWIAGWLNKKVISFGSFMNIMYKERMRDDCFISLTNRDNGH